MEHKTQVPDHSSLYIGRVVRIVEQQSRPGARLGTVQDRFWKGDEPWVVLQLPSGRRIAVAASWTDLPPEAFTPKKTEPLIHPAGLIAMARYCRGLKAGRRSRRRPKGGPS